MKIAICDDNMEYINTIEDYLDKLKPLKIEYDVFMSGEELLNEYEKNDADYDAVFLDMEMGELDGIETANHIRQTDRYVIIVFVTSHKKYMLRSFECMPFRFLIKPIKFKDFYKVYNEICIKLKDKPETVVFTENRSRTRVFCDDIIFFESCAHSILIHTRDGKVHKIRKTMIELLETIDKSTFVRVHRAFAVDYDGKLPQLDDFILGIEKESILHDKNSGLYFFGSLMKINHIILKGTKRFCRI